MKFEETIDISDLEIVRERMKMDNDETENLKMFRTVKKSDLSQHCPNFELGTKYADDLYDEKFSVTGSEKYRVFHGEQSSSGAKKFVVTISEKSTCEFEYSQHQIQVLQAAALDARTPYSYHDQEEYIDFQSAAMENIETKKACGTQGKTSYLF